MLHEVEERLLRPLEVVEHHDERAALGQHLEQSRAQKIFSVG